MGIHGLLPQLKSIMTPIAVKDLRGQTVAVDTYSWLHKGALSCSMHLCKGIPTSKHIDYCMHRVNLLRHHGVKPVLVFDGGLLPMKIGQETRRARARKENLERALEHEATGNSAAAYECYQKAVDISPSIACELIQVLKKEKVDYIVAPYEADAQMTFLSINKLVDAVITEDSDLIPFGCFRIIYKMDKFGHGVEFNSSKLVKNKELDFTGFTKTMLLEMCIFSGCDYLQSLPGMGLKRAHALVQKFKSYEKVIKHLRYSAVVVPPLYEETFKKAMWAFQHQRVYDPVKEDIVHLSDILHNDFVLDLEFLGPWLSRDIVQGIAKGDIDPLTKMPFQGKEASTNWTQSENHPDKEFASVGGRKRLNLPVQKNVVTNYFCLASLEAKRKFIAPKAMSKRSTYMESSSPTIADHVSSLPDSAEEAVTCTSPESQRSLLSSANFVDLPPEDAVVDKSSSETENDKLADASSNGNINDSELPHCMLKTNNEALEPVLASDKEYSRKPKANEAKSSTICLSRRSSYFKKALVDENEHRSQHEDSTLDKQGVHGVLYGCPMSKSAPFANYHENSIIKRRKQSHSPDSYMGPLQYDKVPTGASLPKEDNSCKLTDESVNTEKLNLGCDISHLNNYSGIAEKSMERFMSLISSFRYSSGSRASGLRAPLKDVQNIRSRRLKIHNRQP